MNSSSMLFTWYNNSHVVVSKILQTNDNIWRDIKFRILTRFAKFYVSTSQTNIFLQHCVGTTIPTWACIGYVFCKHGLNTFCTNSSWKSFSISNLFECVFSLKIGIVVSNPWARRNSYPNWKKATCIYDNIEWKEMIHKLLANKVSSVHFLWK